MAVAIKEQQATTANYFLIAIAIAIIFNLNFETDKRFTTYYKSMKRSDRGVENV
jgi:hypothetical protein